MMSRPGCLAIVISVLLWGVIVYIASALWPYLPPADEGAKPENYPW